MRTEGELDVIRRGNRDDPIDDRKLRVALAAGRWVRIAPGAYLPGDQWRALTPIQQHRVRVDEAIRRLKPHAVLSHFAAAAVWGIDILGRWPTTIDTTVSHVRGGRSTGGIRRHGTTGRKIDTAPYNGIHVTTPAQTAADLARALPFVRAVASLDQAIWTMRVGGALTDGEQITECLAQGGRGVARAMRALEFAKPLAANVRESQARVVLAQLGFPTPRLQERRVLRTGRLVFGDFYFPDNDHWVEFDGRAKYLHPEFGASRTPVEIVIDEKRREDEIRREVRGFSRIEPRDIDLPRRAYDILTADGLPSRFHRP